MKALDHVRYKGNSYTIKEIYIQENSSNDILLIDNLEIPILVNHNELMNQCTNCSKFETELGSFNIDENKDIKFSAPCYLTKEKKLEDSCCENIDIFDYYKKL